MKPKSFILAAVLLATALLGAQRKPAPSPEPQFATILDLSHEISDKTPAYDLKDKFEAHTAATYEKDGYFARTFCMPEHFGTHLDAPAHFARGRWTVDQIPPERLVAPLVVIDVSPQVDKDSDYTVSMGDIGKWEQVNGRIPPGAVVVARTGWGMRWNSAEKYRNADAKGIMHFPGWSVEAARFLVENRDIYGLGIDTLSVDPGPSTSFPVHKYTMARSVYHLENLANLSRAPEAGGTAVVASLKLQGGSGSPARVLVLVR